MRISRHFLTLGERQVHFRCCGRGPPVIVLHQSPTSSRDCEPIIRRLAHRHRVFAPDMPGYGASDPLAGGIPDIETLADNVLAFMDALGIPQCGLYGFHTGASIANSLARRHPERVAAAVLVGLLHLNAAEREDFLEHYAPPFRPNWDGSHLTWLWSRIKDQSLFFPWYRRSTDTRLGLDGPEPAALQAILLDWLRAGEDYSLAYLAAFRYRPELDLPHIVTPHCIVAHPGDPLFAHLDRLARVPPHCRVSRCDTAGAVQDTACEMLRQFCAPDAPVQIVPARPLRGRAWADYLTVAGMQLRVLRNDRSDTRPLLLLHDAQSSVSSLRSLIEESGNSHAMLALELPGHGESDSLPVRADYGIEAMAELVGEALRSLDITDIDLFGIGAGAAIQAAFAARREVSVSSLLLLSAIDVADDLAFTGRLLDSYPHCAEPDFFGGHLLRAWHETREHLLCFPWFERQRGALAPDAGPLDASSIHHRTVDALLSGAAGYALRRAEIRFPLMAAIASVDARVRFAAARFEPRFAHTQSLAERSAREFRTLRDATKSMQATAV